MDSGPSGRRRLCLTNLDQRIVWSLSCSLICFFLFYIIFSVRFSWINQQPRSVHESLAHQGYLEAWRIYSGCSRFGRVLRSRSLEIHLGWIPTPVTGCENFQCSRRLISMGHLHSEGYSWETEGEGPCFEMLFANLCTELCSPLTDSWTQESPFNPGTLTSGSLHHS